MPVKYGGLSKEGEFGTADAVTEITVKPATKQTVEFPVNEVGIVLFLGFCLNFENPMTPLGNVLYVFPSNQTSRESFLGSSEHSVVVSTVVVIITATVDLCFGGNKTRKKKDDFFFY